MSGRRESLTDKAYAAIEKLIVTAELTPGAWISENAIADRIGLGRTPVREAIQRLSRHQLVEITTGRGPRVTDIDAREQLLITELRREIERLLFRRAVRFATPADHQALKALARTIDEHGAQPDALVVLGWDLEAKTMVLGCAKHRFAAEAIKPLWAASRRFCWIFRTPESLASTAAGVRQVIDVVLGGDEGAAERLVERHMDELDAFVRSTLERRPMLPAP